MQIDKTLKTFFGFDSFRPLQREIIESVLQGENTLALLPTGGGKSICYQLPMLLKPGIGIVVSPLIALMQDQVAHLQEKNIAAIALHSGLKNEAIYKILEQLNETNCKILYISPERIQSSVFREFIQHLPINLIAVDEAHCISQWGPDFRPDYLKINQLKKLFPSTPILALTASATNAVQKDILLQLEMPNAKLFKQSFDRTNLFYKVTYSEHKLDHVLQHINHTNGSILIYCKTRKQTEVLTHFLKENNKETFTYHAGMNKQKRVDAQEGWMQSEQAIMVATNAFGMGIDKAHVRLVIHYDLPEHLEAYYQEAGRAGRDGAPAKAVTLYNQQDIKMVLASAALQYPDGQFLQLVYQSVCEYLQIPLGIKPDQLFSFDLSEFCKRFKLPLLPSSNALRLLAQEGLWILTDAFFRPVTVMIFANRNTLDEIINKETAVSSVLINLLRLYGTLFHYPTIIRLPLLAKHCKMKIAQVEACLNQLHQQEIILFEKNSEGEYLKFNHIRADSKHLILDYKRIRLLKEKQEERTQNLIHYLENKTHCRSKLLLHYFNEEYKKDCQHCDICEGKKESQKPQLTETDILNYIKKQAVVRLEELTLHFTTIDIDKLLQFIRNKVEEETLAYTPDGQIRYNN